MFRFPPFYLLTLGLPFLAALPACAQQANTALGETKKAIAPSPVGPLLHPLFSDNAVLQRDRPVPIWGWTAPGQIVRVQLDTKSWTTRADASGKWMVRIDPYRAGGPHTLHIFSPNGEEMATRENILFGDVWICSGQSNMQWRVSDSNNANQEIAQANFPNIRLLQIPTVTSLLPRNTVDAAWQVCTPQAIGSFSAVGYFFGRKLHRELGVPIGLINSSWGGTVAEAWVSEGALNKMPNFVEPVATVKRVAEELANDNGAYEKRMIAWWDKEEPGLKANWNAVDAPDADWNLLDLPKNWDAPDGPLPRFDGVVWFRREIQIPNMWAGRDLILNLSIIDDSDTTFWNGTKEVGETSGHVANRSYTVASAQVKAGRNVIAIRVLDGGGLGGFGGKVEDMDVSAVGLDAAPLPLPGAWRFEQGIAKDQMPPDPKRLNGNPNVSTVLYNAMIAPLTPAAIKGAIWYQGESNAARAAQYQTLPPTLINDWRAFQRWRFPFHIVQLANFQAPDDTPRDEGWPRLQEAQLLTARTLPKTGLAVINDIGDTNDIHPRSKQNVGLRLALIALAKDYGKKVEYSGPTLKSHIVRGNSIVLKFDHAQGGLSLRGDAKIGIAIAGADQKFVWATPKIAGDTITVSSPEVPNPVALRFAWSPNPRANLVRTDAW